MTENPAKSQYASDLGLGDLFCNHVARLRGQRDCAESFFKTRTATVNSPMTWSRLSSWRSNSAICQSRELPPFWVPPANAAEDSDTQFAFTAAAGGMSEVNLGTLAAQKGNDPSVKQFGQRMVTDHSKAGDELKSTAIQSKITLPADVSKFDAETYAKLSKLSGAEFDKAHANEMAKDHEKDVAEFQKEAMSGKIHR